MVEAVPMQEFDDVPQEDLDEVPMEYETFSPGINCDSKIVQICEYCGANRREFKNSLMFREHCRKHLNPKETCSVCGKICGTKVQLEKHQVWQRSAGRL